MRTVRDIKAVPWKKRLHSKKKRDLLVDATCKKATVHDQQVAGDEARGI
jgi:hypothetical protein